MLQVKYVPDLIKRTEDRFVIEVKVLSKYIMITTSSYGIVKC